jgi:hypothetical protein
MRRAVINGCSYRVSLGAHLNPIPLRYIFLAYLGDLAVRFDNQNMHNRGSKVTDIRLSPVGGGASDTPQIEKAIRDVGAGGRVILLPRGPASHPTIYIIKNTIHLQNATLCGEADNKWDDVALPLLQSEISASGRNAATVQLSDGGILKNVHIAPDLSLPETDPTRTTGVAATGNLFVLDNVKIFGMYDGIATGRSDKAGDDGGNGDWKINNCYIAHAINRGMILRGCNSKADIVDVKIEESYFPIELLDNGPLYFSKVFLQAIRPEPNKPLPPNRDCAVYIKKWFDEQAQTYRYCEAYFDYCNFTDFRHGIRIRDGENNGSRHRLTVTNSTYIGDDSFLIDWAPGALKTINYCPKMEGNSGSLVRLCPGVDEADWKDHITGNSVFFPANPNSYFTHDNWGEDINRNNTFVVGRDTGDVITQARTLISLLEDFVRRTEESMLNQHGG